MGYFRRQQEYPVFADTALQMGGRQSKCPLNLKLPEHVTKAEKGFGVGERDSGFPAIWKERCGWSECFGLRNRPNASAGPPFDDAPMTEETGGRFSNVASLGRQIDRQRGRNQTSAISSYLIRSATRFRWCRCRGMALPARHRQDFAFFRVGSCLAAGPFSCRSGLHPDRHERSPRPLGAQTVFCASGGTSAAAPCGAASYRGVPALAIFAGRSDETLASSPARIR